MWAPRIFISLWYCIPMTSTEVSHSPTAKAFDFDTLIFAPDAAAYWSLMVRILRISLDDVTSSVTSSA